MVVKWLVLLVATDLAFAVTPDELRMITGEVERKNKVRSHQVDPNQMSRLIPVDKSQGDERKRFKVGQNLQENQSDAPVISKDNSTKKLQPIGAEVSPPSVKKSKAADESIGQYIPPPRQDSYPARIQTDAVHLNQQHYGIRMGAWLEATLERNATSADPGRVEIVLIKDSVGDLQTLPAGTILFADKVYNAGTSRLDLKVKNAITPTGKELDVSGIVYDKQRMAGLLGYLSQPAVDKSLKNGAAKGLLNAAVNTIDNMLGMGAISEVADSTIDAVVSSRREMRGVESTETIHVAAQEVVVRIEKTF